MTPSPGLVSVRTALKIAGTTPGDVTTHSRSGVQPWRRSCQPRHAEKNSSVGSV